MRDRKGAIESGLKYLARAIVARADGHMYVPIFERLEEELQRLSSESCLKNRIRKLADLD